MGYQALLFCPDEKLARVVTQVFTELDFNVEPANEPFAAVKKLMAHRYDAVVVDCENEQNATLLLKSARNSGSNQNSLALALVEGQSGVAKAYRIGANLVLTKPINVEQAKGTLRVARGLLRKNADPANAASAATSAATAHPAPAPAASAPKPQPPAPATPPSKPVFQAPAFESALPAMAASAKHEDAEIAAAAAEFAEAVSIQTEAPKAQQPVAAAEPAKPVIAPPAPPAPPVKIAPPTSVGSQGAAAAPAPAKEAPAPEPKADSEFLEVARTLSAPHIESAPSFGGLSESDAAEDSGGSKKLLGIAAALVVCAALGYFGWTKFGAHSASVAPATAPVVAQPSAPAMTTTAPPPVMSPSSVPGQTAPSSVVPQASKPSAAVNTAPTTKIFIDSEPAPAKPEQAPIHVKTQTAIPTAVKPQADESAPVPNPLAVGAANEKNLTGLIASSPTTLPKQAPGTVRISQGVSQGLLINRVQPKYPQNALAMRIEGSVQLEATINKEGKISNLKVITGHPLLGRAAAEAVRQWRYKPYYLDGTPVDIQTQITVNFKLPN